MDYQFQVEFFIQHDIVPALKFVNTVSKAIFSDKSTFVMGSYAPRVEKYTFKSPVQTAPSGMLARGKYSANTKF
ncbi:rho GDP-dissociation inhibitor, partial [Escherichia coli]|nr:rho GDP-dissociation inhibitor [Escherichia coli]